jgi:hypothetical protein
MLPEFDASGNLPPGIHQSTWEEITERYGKTERRRDLLKGLGNAISMLRDMGCKRIFLDGSFISNKVNPGDYDVVWDDTGLDLDLCFKECWTFFKSVYTQKQEFGGEFCYMSHPSNVLAYFQQDNRHTPILKKGIIELSI